MIRIVEDGSNRWTTLTNQMPLEGRVVLKMTTVSVGFLSVKSSHLRICRFAHGGPSSVVAKDSESTSNLLHEARQLKSQVRL